MLTQSHQLHTNGHGLGARILLRSGLETLSTLIYLNQKIKMVVENNLKFEDFSKLTAELALGSKNDTSMPDPVSVLKTLDKSDQQYPGLRSLYDGLSESAHPNFEGLVWGYSKVNHNECETNFSNRWMEIYGKRHLDNLDLCMEIYHIEYDQIWPNRVEKLEQWIVENDHILSQNQS